MAKIAVILTPISENKNKLTQIRIKKTVFTASWEEKYMIQIKQMLWQTKPTNKKGFYSQPAAREPTET